MSVGVSCREVLETYKVVDSRGLDWEIAALQASRLDWEIVALQVFWDSVEVNMAV